MKRAIGIDIGGTKIAVASIESDGRLSSEVKVFSDTSSAESMFNSLVEGLTLFFEKNQSEVGDYIGMGIGVPGKVDSENGIAIFQNNLPWENFPLVSKLHEVYGEEISIIIDNDVYQAAYGEWIKAEVSREDTFVYYTISTGIACAIIDKGEFLRGSGFAGEIGFIPVTQGAGLQGLNRLEEVASGPAIEKKGRERYGIDNLTTEELFERYHLKETDAVEIIDQMIAHLTESVYGIMSLLDPKKIVFGGSLSIHQPFIIRKIIENLEEYLVPAQAKANEVLSVSQLENQAGIVGAGLRVFTK